MGNRIQNFRQRLRARASLLGTFVKTPSPMICELLSETGLDVLCIDAEHAPFGRLEIDQAIAALRAADQPSLVRVAECSAAEIRNALDCGATGILVPHVVSVEQARSIVAATRFGEGGRGFSASTRAADYGARTVQQHIDASHTQTAIVVQIEDIAALGSVAGIAAVDGIDCVFVGRVDLAVALGLPSSAVEVVDAVARVCSTGRAAGAAVGMFCPGLDEVARWRAAGASFFMIGSDQSLLMTEARRLVASFREM